MEFNHNIFLSYSWADKSIADEIDERFEGMPLHIMRDVRDLGDFERIKDYMKKVRGNDYAVIIISENYLKSKYCMYEILEMFKEADYNSRILPLIVSNAEIFSPLIRAGYIRFWKNEYNSLKQTIDEINDITATTALADDLKMINNIYRDIDEIITVFAGMKCPRTVAELFNSICNKLGLMPAAGTPQAHINTADTEKSSDEKHSSPISIKVIGIGGGGNNAICRMMEDGAPCVEMIAVNTDRKALQETGAAVKLPIGERLTGGACSYPALGRKAMEEDRQKMASLLKGADIVFILAGMGGGTGTGAAPVVAGIARKMGILTIAIVTMPFHFEGQRRMNQAEEGARELRNQVDSLILVYNEQLKIFSGQKITFAAVFRIADEVIKQLVQSISNFNTKQLINLSFTDVRVLMSNAGFTYFGVGTASGRDKAVNAGRQAIQAPLLKANISGAKGVIITVTGNADLKFGDVEAAVNLVKNAAHHSANIIFGTVIDETLEDEIRVVIIAAGLNDSAYHNNARLLS